MGSHTIDIFRQGFWASLTGGWFFDPHQDIFCNTFHMYLWIALLLTPFILYLTAESIIIPTVIYSLVVFIFFSLVKIINYKLHILFDGEELLEVKSTENAEIGDVPGTSNSHNNTLDDSVNKKRPNSFAEQEDLPETQINVSLEEDNNISTPQINVSIKEEIENTLKKSETNDTESFSTLELPDNSSSTNELYLPLSNVKSSSGHKEDNNIEQTSEKSRKGDNDDVVPSLEIIENAQSDDNLIIANKPTVKDFENSPKQTSSTQVGVNQQFPLSLHKLIDTSSESSWGTSSGCSSDSDIANNKVRFMPIDTKQGDPVLPDKDLGAVKSENSLMLKSNEIKDDANATKAISLSASAMKELSLAEENKSKLSHSSGRRTTVNESVGLSLPALPTLNEYLEDVNGDGPSTSYSVQQNATADNVEKEVFKQLAMLGEFDDDLYKLTEKLELHSRPIRRQGAFRQSGGDQRSYQRVRQRTDSGSPITGNSLLTSEGENLEKDNKHIAMSHEDTSAGAVHCFQDETGQWYSYAFGDGAAVPLQRDVGSDNLQSFFETRSRIPGRRNSSISNSSQQEIDTVIRDLISNPFMWRSQSNPFSSSQFARPTSVEMKASECLDAPPSKYYMLPIIGSYSIKVSFDRLALLSLLDRNKNVYQAIFGTILGSMVALLGYVLLSRQYLYDFWAFLLCFVIAKCQFSLLKSVQPDAASPIHGHNNTVVFSRAIYFCITAILIIVMDEASMMDHDVIYLYGVPIYSKDTFIFAREALIVFLLAFPLVFLFGFLPQIDTFTMHVLEQTNIHVFGGSAVTSVIASIFSFGRAIVVTFILSSLCYASAVLSDGSPGASQHVLFSVFSGILVAISYHLSRSTSSPDIVLSVIKKNLCCNFVKEEKRENHEIDDPLPAKLFKTVECRLTHDGIVCIVIAFFVFAVHLSTVFTSLQPTLSTTLFILTGSLGVFIHYIIPQFRKQLPWLLLASPVMKPYEYMLYEWQEPSKITWFEKLYVWLCLVEKNFLYPIVCMSELTREADQVLDKFGLLAGSVIVVICSLKLLCNSFNNTAHQHIILIWTVLFFNFDFDGHSETFLIDYFFMAIFVEKMLELFLKFKFILTYTAPWQILWGSAFHAFAQPVSIPHCGMLFLQAVVSAFFSAPLNPFLGSAIFLTSYMRPIKFWEKDYNTKRVDHSNTRLSSYIDSNPGADDNNLNSIFYEHLTRSLQHSLCGDLMMGRWGNFSSGDCFIMASDYLNALVHIIEVGNGYITFQLRGLEFRGTYCQQREVEAITENVDDDTGCCCCHPGHLPNFLSFNTAFSQRWLAWEVVQRKYIVEGYSVSDNTATSMFQMFDLRKIFITYYVTSIIFYCIRNKKLLSWLTDDSLMSELNDLSKPSYVDVDTIFRQSTDKDFDVDRGGITRKSFCRSYHDWIVCCNSRRESTDVIEDDSADGRLVTLCYALSLLGRRLLSNALNYPWNAAALKSFLHGLHALFKGDFRVTSSKDDWVFGDSDLVLLRMVVAPAVRMALKLHQDHFTCVDEFDDNEMLHDTISSHEEQYVICHEGHPDWRQAVLHNKPNLLALRYVIDDGSEDYKIIMLTKRCLNFRVIKVNKECVRGLWAGQLQELIFLRNRNPERGSIQNAKQALRNMINSSCDQPIGYPIYVSPLTTSYSETNSFFTSISFGSVSGKAIQGFFQRCYQSMFYRFATHFARSNSQNVTTTEVEMTTYRSSPISGEHHEQPQIILKPSTSNKTGKGVAPPKGIHFRASSYTSLPSNSSCSSSSGSTPNDATSKTKFPYFRSEGKVRLKDITRVTEALNSRLSSKLHWTNFLWFLERAEMASWEGWYPHENMIGEIIYHWEPKHPDVAKRCPFDRKVYLLKIEDYVVPVFEDGIVLLENENKELEV